MRFYKTVISLLYLGSCFLKVSTKEIEFTGQTFIKFDFQPKGAKTAVDEKATIKLNFSTIHPNGVLLYRQGAEAGDFLLLELAHASVRCTGIFKSKPFDIYYLGDHFNDNNWHYVIVEVIDRGIWLHVDSHQRSVRLKSAAEYVQELTMKKSSIFVGMARHQITKRRNYTGCMKTVIFADSDLLCGNPEEFSNCSNVTFYPLQFQSSRSFVKFTVTNPPGSFRASFTFRTFKSRGVIFSVVTISSKFRLRLKSGSLFCDEITPDRNRTLLVLGSRLNDGEWHSVHATLNKTTKRLEVSLDGESNLTKYSPPKAFSGTSQLNISLGKDGEEPGFGGCMFDLQVNIHRYNRHEFRKMNSYHRKLGECKLNNPCFPNPCENDGKCTHEGKDPTCTCKTEYEGATCQDTIYKTTCMMYMEQGLTDNASCSLGTGKESLYDAQCEIQLNHTYTIVQLTNKVKEIKVHAEEDADLDDFYVHNIRYNPDMKKIERLKLDSGHCSQDLTFYSLCGSTESKYPNENAFWKFKNGKAQKYLQLQGSTRCYDFGRCTNCSFTLTDKTKLPVTSLSFHKKYSSSFFTVGPLKCWGRREKYSDDKINVFPKDNERLKEVCDKNSRPTSTPTISTTEKIINHTRSVHSVCNESIKPASDLCINLSSTTRIDSTRSPSSSPSVGKEASGRKQTDSTAEDRLPTALTALLSFSLVAALLLVVKFGLPRCILCLRAHSKSGEYVLSAGKYPTKHKSFTVISNNGGRNKHNCNGTLVEEGTLTKRDNSYWV